MASTVPSDCDNCTSAGSIENGICQVCLAEHEPAEDFSLLQTLSEHDIDPEAFLRRVDCETLRRALQDLRPTTRVLVSLIDVTGMNHRRAGELLGLTASQAKELLASGRRRFRRALWEEASRNGLAHELSGRPRRRRIGQADGMSAMLG